KWLAMEFLTKRAAFWRCRFLHKRNVTLPWVFAHFIEAYSERGTVPTSLPMVASVPHKRRARPRGRPLFYEFDTHSIGELHSLLLQIAALREVPHAPALLRRHQTAYRGKTHRGLLRICWPFVSRYRNRVEPLTPAALLAACRPCFV